MRSLALTPAQQRRIAKLAALAGRTPDAMLRFVLRDGLEATEQDVRETIEADRDIDRNGAIPHGNGACRAGDTRWRRLTELRTRSAKSVFHFDVQGSVAKSTHAGIPWLRYLRRQLGERVHFWPFDGWQIPAARSCVAEVYPAVWKHDFASEGRTADQHDAYSVAAWLRQADLGGQLSTFLSPALTDAERAIANAEGWILGVR